MRKCLMELLGTFFLVLAVCFTGDPLSIGIMLAVMVYAGAHVSGAHYNPAVTTAVLLRKGIGIGDAVKYWFSQILGAALAAYVHYYVTSETFVPSPGEGVTFGVAVIMETLGTFVLAFVVLNVATARKIAGNYIYGLAIGFALFAAIAVSVDISGGVVNPAVAIGPMLVDTLTAKSLGFSNVLVYLVGPLLGAVLASLTFGYTNEE